MTRQAVHFCAEFVNVEYIGGAYMAIFASVEVAGRRVADVWRIPVWRITRLTGLRGQAVEGVAVVDDMTGELLAVRNVRRLAE